MASPSTTGSVTEDLAAYSLSTDFSKLSAEVIDRTKRVIADETACMLMGSAMEPGKVIRNYVASLGGNPDSTIMGGGLSTSPPYAALANGTSAHSDEMDGTHPSQGHPGGASLAGTLAVAESRSLGGTDLINAVALSYDIGTRVAMAMGGAPAVRREHHTYGSVLYSIGIAGACGRLLNLEQLQVQHAFSLAMMNVNVPASFYDERKHMSKAMNQGQIAFGGVSGALLASHGFEAHDHVMEAKDGIIEGWQTSDGDLSLITAGLGTNFEVMNSGFKYFSAGYPIHSPLAGSLSLMADNGITANDVAKVRVHLSPTSADTVDGRTMPSISLQYMLSIGMTLGQLTHTDAHNEELYERPDIARLRSGIEIVRDETMGRREAQRRESWVEIDTLDGRTFVGSRRIPPGHWEDGGMPWDDLKKKFDSLVSPVLGSEPTEWIWSILSTLEDHENLDTLTELLRGASK